MMKMVLFRLLLISLLLAGAGRVWADQGHEHAAQASAHQDTKFIDPSLLGFTGLNEIFNTHPVFVHFPIALFPSALLLYGLGIFLKRPSWVVAGRACLYLAAAGTALTLVTGWQAQTTFPHNARIHHMMMTHLRIGLAIGVLGTGLVIWSFVHRGQQPKGAYVFLVVLAFTTYWVLQNGDLGSRMVYIEGAAVKPAVSVITGGLPAGMERPMPQHPAVQDESLPHAH